MGNNLSLPNQQRIAEVKGRAGLNLTPNLTITAGLRTLRGPILVPDTRVAQVTTDSLL